MAYPICYLINISGDRFNRLMATARQVPEEYFSETKLEPDVRDGMLPNDNTVFLVELSGKWTLLKLRYPPYSTLLHESQHPELVQRVRVFEHALQALTLGADIWRVDDVLLDEWNSRFDYRLVQDTKAINEFLTLLSKQDSRHWAKLA